MPASPRLRSLLFHRMAWLYVWLTNNALWRSSVQEMARHFPPGAAELRVLDVGCGPGNSALQLLEYRPDLKIVGLDSVPAMLKRARQASYHAGRANKTRWLQGDAAWLPLPDSSVDAITAHSVFYLLPDRDTFLREALRVLRP